MSVVLLLYGSKHVYYREGFPGLYYGSQPSGNHRRKFEIYGLVYVQKCENVVQVRSLAEEDDEVFTGDVSLDEVR